MSSGGTGSPRGRAVATPAGDVLLVNEKALGLLGLSREEAAGGILAAYPGLRSAMAEGRVAAELVEAGGSEGGSRRLIVDVEPLSAIDGSGDVVAVAVAESGSSRWLAVALTILAEGTRAVLEGTSEAELLQAVCDVIVRAGGYRLAWVGRWTDGRPSEIDVLAVSGTHGILEHGLLPAAPVDDTASPSLRAALTGEVQVCQDLVAVPGLARWHGRMLAEGIRSSISIPFDLGGGEHGLLALYAPETDGFDPLVRELLTQVAENVGYALRSLEARAATAQSAARFDALMQASGLMVLMSDGDGHTTRMSPALARFLGRDAIDASAVHPDDTERARRGWWDVRRSGQPQVEEFRLRRADGAWRTVVMTVIPYRRPGQAEWAEVAILQDITPQLELQARLAAASRLDAIASLAAGVAVEVKQLLLTMVGSVAILEDDPTDDARQVIETLNRAARDANRLLRKLVALGQDASATPEPVDVAAVVDGVARMARASVRPGHAVVVEHAGRPVRVLADRLELERAVVNLVRNADDAIEQQNGTITLRVLAPGDGRVGIAVADEGTGIPPQVLDHLWDAFFTTKPEGQGTGLGLPSARSIARAAGGDIEVETAPGEGSTFTIWLPELEPSPEPPAAASD